MASLETNLFLVVTKGRPADICVPEGGLSALLLGPAQLEVLSDMVTKFGWA